jgi:hypothetical protein
MYKRWIFMPLALVALALLWQSDVAHTDRTLVTEIGIWLGALFALCMLCHGELVRRRPGVAGLTRFYLAISVGGALGGVFVGVVAPRIFASTVELRLLALTIPAAVGFLLSLEPAAPARTRRLSSRELGLAFAAAGSVLAFVAVDPGFNREALLASGRNFFGVFRVEETQESDEEPVVRSLYHGRIRHGVERLDPARPREPLSYYSRPSGVAMAIRAAGRRGGRRIGVVGLGAGSIAGYARPGDVVRFYEINPLSEVFARAFFTYLPQCPCRAEVVLGDARLVLDREPAQRFDVLALDAFSGDAIPVHLLTTEAFRIYEKHLAPEGILAVHISNWYVDLSRVTRGAARELGLHAVLVSNETDEERSWDSADWVLMAREAAPLASGEIMAAARPDWRGKGPVVWTDDFHSVFGVLRWER